MRCLGSHACMTDADWPNMNIRLKTKLTISYVLLSLLLVGSILLLSNYFLEQRFQAYILEKQETENQNIVTLVTKAFGTNGELPNNETLENIGETALSQGLVLMVNDLDNRQLYCTSTLYSNRMIENMKIRMASVYPDFHGEYTEKVISVIKEGKTVGTITLGYYGPFYYNDGDVQFLKVLNNIYLGVAVIFLAIAAFLGTLIAGRISRPIRKVIEQTRQMEKGNYTDRLQITSRTMEINQLIHGVNTLAYALECQLESKKRMTHNYAHELRTPLSTLQLNLEAMIDGIWIPTPERLESCRDEVLRLNRMLSDLDKIVKIEDQSFQLNKTKVDLANLIENIALTFQPVAVKNNVVLKTELIPCILYCDQDKMSQVIINLLSNALKYTNTGGYVKVVLTQSDDFIDIIVSDTGIGIAEEDIPHIFENLYRVDKSRNRETGGCGIGLSIVKGIVNAHEGSIEVQSELYHGSSFKIRLPIQTEK